MGSKEKLTYLIKECRLAMSILPTDECPDDCDEENLCAKCHAGYVLRIAVDKIERR